MVFALAEQGDAPRAFSRVSSTRAPRNAIVLSSLIGVVSVALNYFMPEQVFSLLVNSTGGVGIFVWLIVAVSHLRSRRLAGAGGSGVINYILIVGLLALLVYMGITEAHRLEVLISVTVAVVLAALGAFTHRHSTTVSSHR